MSYRNHYSGSPWQQGGPPFGVSNYGQNYGGYNDHYSVMSPGYGRNQGSYPGNHGMYSGGGGGGMSSMRNMGYGGPSPSRYGNDRMGGGRQLMSRGQMQRKRLPQRSPAGGPRSKRPNLSSSDRRMSKPRRRRDSRGGSKGRGRDHSDDDNEDDTYNPAEPTDDASDVEIEGYDSWKCSSEEENEPEVAKENGEQPVEESAEGEKKEPAKSARKFVCYVCKVTCSTESKHRRHQASKTHTVKIEELLAIRRGKKGSGEEDKSVSDKESRDGKKKSSRKPGNWCTVCECAFGGNFLAHRRTKEHRKKRDKKYPKCRPCRLGFSSSEEYRDHYKSEDHKNRSAEFHYLKGLISGSDEDEAAILPLKPDTEEEEEKVIDEIKMETEDEATSEEAKPKEEKMEADSEAEKVKSDEENADESEKKEEGKKKEESEGKSPETKKLKSREPKAFGQSFVVSVQGYYCKLCRKFFKDVTIAKSKHCRSAMHTQAFKKAMEEAIEQEEERQKLADEQDQLDLKAAEEAELAAEIVAIERAAKDAAKREAAKKKADASKGEDVEMKDVAEGDGAKDEKSGDSASADSKAEENGVKEQVESESTDTNAEKDDEKANSGEKPTDAQEESADGDDVEDDEQEKEITTKEEVSSSPATRRGRGRGRGRKRR